MSKYEKGSIVYSMYAILNTGDAVEIDPNDFSDKCVETLEDAIEAAKVSVACNSKFEKVEIYRKVEICRDEEYVATYDTSCV